MTRTSTSVNALCYLTALFAGQVMAQSQPVQVIPLHTSFLVNEINNLRAVYKALFRTAALRPVYANQALSTVPSAVLDGL